MKKSGQSTLQRTFTIKNRKTFWLELSPPIIKQSRIFSDKQKTPNLCLGFFIIRYF